MTVRSLPRRSKAQSIVETVVGLIFLVPIVLFLLDVAVVVLGNMANDNLAKSCCRAAASATNPSPGVSPANPSGAPVGDAATAFAAATSVAGNFASSGILGPSGGGGFLTGFFYNSTQNPGSAGGSFPGAPAPPSTPPQPGTGQVACVTTMVVTLPVPFPVLPSKYTFAATDYEPIVSVQPGQ